jgi:hypothetical protein
MRMTTLAVLVFGLVIVQTDRGRAQASGTQSELADDVLGGTLWHIAVTTQSRIGFESVEFVRTARPAKKRPYIPCLVTRRGVECGCGGESPLRMAGYR